MIMLKIINDLFNMPRSITGEPIKKTIKYIKKKIPELYIMRFKSRAKVLIGQSLMNGIFEMHLLKMKKGKKYLILKKIF